MRAVFHAELILAFSVVAGGCLGADPNPGYYAWAQTPPMGWNSWDDFATTVTEAQTHAQAEVMKAKLASHGWDLITIDIQWYEPTLLTSTGSQRLTSLTWVSATSGLGVASTEHGARGASLWVAGKAAPFGIGAHPQSVIEYDLPAGATRFVAFAGIDERGEDPTHGWGGGVRFLVFTQSPYATQASAQVPVKLSELGMGHAAQVRDLWQGKDLGRMDEKFSPSIAAHGADLYRISPAN